MHHDQITLAIYCNREAKQGGGGAIASQKLSSKYDLVIVISHYEYDILVIT